MMELVFNIWFVVDIASQTTTRLYIKPYCISGDDNVKFDTLATLAEWDYLSVNPIDFCEECKLMEHNKELLQDGVLQQEYIDQFIDVNINYFVSKVQKVLPVDHNKTFFNFDAIAKNPLFVCTLLMRNKQGVTKPFTTEENRKWCFLEASKYSREAQQAE